MTNAMTNGHPGAGSLPHLLDIPTLAEYLSITERHVRRLVAERRLPFVKVGRLVRFDPADVAQWLSRARVDTEEAG